MPEIVIFERRSRWGPELCRISLANDRESASRRMPEVKITSVRAVSAAQANRWNEKTIIVLDSSAGIPECLHLLGRFMAESKRRHVIVIGNPSSHPLEWIFYEMGVNVYLSDCHHGEQLMDVCRRVAGPIA